MTEVVKSLIELQNDCKTLAAAWQKLTYGTPEYNDAKLALFKAEKLVDAKLSADKKAVAEQKEAEARQARIQLRTTYGAAILAANAKGAGQAEKDALTAAEVALDNALLPNHKSPSAPKSEGSTGTRGNVSAEIRSLIIGFMKGGMTATEAVKACQEEANGGHSRGTSGAVRTQMVKDGEIDATGALTI